MRVLSGVKPTGEQTHLGNYFGAMKRFVELQDQHECLFFVAGYHALTTIQDASQMEKNSTEVVREYLAIGLDPQKAHLFLQTAVPEVTELAWILNCVTPMGLLERAHAYKDALAKNKSVNVGVFDYPVLMAADILIYDSDLVPVGKDQKQHVEIARDLAESFNHIFGETFKLPEPLIDETTQTIPGLDGQKMSKSYHNTLMLFETEENIRKKIMGIPTDSKTVAEPKDPNQCNLYQLYKLVDPAGAETLAKHYQAGGLGYGEIKQRLIEKILAFLKPLREKYQSITETEIQQTLKKGGTFAKKLAQAKIQAVRKKVGFPIY